MPLRSPKMNRFIFGFQRRVWCPKWTPASSSCFMVTTATMGSLPVGSLCRPDAGAGPGARGRGDRGMARVLGVVGLGQAVAGPSRTMLAGALSAGRTSARCGRAEPAAGRRGPRRG